MKDKDPKMFGMYDRQIHTRTHQDMGNCCSTNIIDPDELRAAIHYVGISVPSTVTGRSLERWIEFMEDSIQEPGVVQGYVTKPGWIQRAAPYQSILSRGETIVYGGHRFRKAVLREKSEVELYSALLQEMPDRVIHTVGSESLQKLDKYDLKTIGDLLRCYQNLDLLVAKFAVFCLFLLVDVQLADHVFFRVALFIHIVSMLEVGRKASLALCQL